VWSSPASTTSSKTQVAAVATGLFSRWAKIVDDKVCVLGRDDHQLHDLNGDGEADFYENFNNDGGHHRRPLVRHLRRPIRRELHPSSARPTEHGRTVLRSARTARSRTSPPARITAWARTDGLLSRRQPGANGCRRREST
jgi:hypothetical protein